MCRAKNAMSGIAALRMRSTSYPCSAAQAQTGHRACQRCFLTALVSTCSTLPEKGRPMQRTETCVRDGINRVSSQLRYVMVLQGRQERRLASMPRRSPAQRPASQHGILAAAEKRERSVKLPAGSRQLPQRRLSCGWAALLALGAASQALELYSNQDEYGTWHHCRAAPSHGRGSLASTAAACSAGMRACRALSRHCRCCYWCAGRARG